MLGSDPSENSPFPTSAKGRIEVEQWRLAFTTLHTKWWPRNDIVRIEATFHDKPARHIPVQGKYVAFRLNAPVELGKCRERCCHAGPAACVIAQFGLGVAP